MLRGTVAPARPFGIPADVLAPLPPLFPPLDLPVLDEVDPVVGCWLATHAHLVALHALYQGSGHYRANDRLQSLFEGTHAVLLPWVGPQVLAKVSMSAAAAGRRVLEDYGLVVASSEGGWWAVAAQGAFALAAWYGLRENPAELDPQELAIKLNRKIRQGIEAMFGLADADRILTAATGDGAGDLLKLVAEVSLADAPLAARPLCHGR